MSRWRPRVRLLRRPATVREPFAAHWMSDELKKQTLTPPAQASNVDFVRLENDENAFLDFDGVPWMPMKVRASALLLRYGIKFIPTTAASWIHTALAEEQKWRDLLLVEYASRLKELKEQLDAAVKSKDAESQVELQKEINELESLETQLKPGGQGFLRTSYGAMGTRTSGVFWGLSAPNVPVEFTSAFTLPRDRAISFRLQRYKAPKEQAKYEWRIEFEGGQTCYALVFGDDGNSAQFIHYRSMTPAVRAQKRARIEKLLDYGRLIPSERKQLIAWEDEERSIQLTAQKREQGKTDLTSAEKQRISVLRSLADKLRDKKPTPAQEKEQQKLERDLYLAQESFSLQENATELLGKPVDVTVQFLRAGYIVVRCGTMNFVYENARITGAEPHEFHFGLPDKSLVKIHSDGGKWGLVWGQPDWGGEGILRSSPFEWAQPLSNEDCTFAIVGDAIGDASMDGKLIELRAPVVGGSHPQAGLYQIELTLKGTEYTPEIYSVAVHRPAEIEELSSLPVLFDSTEEVISPVRDVLMSDDKRRARHAQVVIARPLVKLQNLPEAAVGMVCEIELVDAASSDVEGSLKTFLHYGCVKRGERGRVGRLETTTGLSAIDLTGGEWVLDVVGCEGFLDRKITASWAGDGMWPGDYIRLLCADARLPPELWSRIPQGEAAHKALGWDRIPPTRPGRYPAFKPRPGLLFWAHIQATAQNHCPGGALWNDGQGLRLDRNLVRDRRDLKYGTPASGVSVHSKLCLRNQEGFKWAQDLRDYVTSATIVGKKDPLTGVRVMGTDSVPQASDPRFSDSVFYVEEDIPYVSEPLDSLTSKGACERVAHDKLSITPLTPDGLAPWWGSIECDLDPEVLTGDMVQIFGVNFVVDTLDLGTLGGQNAGRMKASVQCAQDISIRRFSQ